MRPPDQPSDVEPPPTALVTARPTSVQSVQHYTEPALLRLRSRVSVDRPNPLETERARPATRALTRLGRLHDRASCVIAVGVRDQRSRDDRARAPCRPGLRQPAPRICNTPSEEGQCRQPPAKAA